MHCPIDNETLVMTERNGVEIDYCPKCRGVWLDRGELDKILERTGGGPSQPPAPPPSSGRPEPERYSDDDDRGRRPYRKKEGFLKELFDF